MSLCEVVHCVEIEKNKMNIITHCQAAFKRHTLSTIYSNIKSLCLLIVAKCHLLGAFLLNHSPISMCRFAHFAFFLLLIIDS